MRKARKFTRFFSIITHKLDFTSMETLHHYRLWDEQEKYFHQMKGQLSFNRQRNWSEDGKSGRLLILFVALIMSSYVKHIWRTSGLKDDFDSFLAVLDEMKPILIIEHKAKTRSITPFIGSQMAICDAFGSKVPDGFAPTYVSRKKAPKLRGRRAKQKNMQFDT